MVALGNSHEYANLSEDFLGVSLIAAPRLSSSQTLIFSYFEEIVRAWSPEKVLIEFKNLFVHHVNPIALEAFQVLQNLVRDNREQDFRCILKRSCYILFKNWASNGCLDWVGKMLQLMTDPSLTQKTFSPSLKRVKMWVRSFAQSQDYRDLQQLVQDYSRYQNSAQSQSHWSDRYVVYQWIARSTNLSNPPEQRELANLVAQRMKDRFKYDLAMYTARAQSAGYDRQTYPNPTIFGDDALRLIKLLVARRRDGGYEQIGRRFIEQTNKSTYFNFKQQFQTYLFNSCKSQNDITTLQKMLARKLNLLYPSKQNEQINSALTLVTCNRAIEWLTTENHQEPSAIFQMLVSRGNPLTLAIALLKLVLISPNSRVHLECCLADLVGYYKQLPESECPFVIQFFEFMKIVLAIYAGDVEYSLVKLQNESETHDSPVLEIDRYRVFLTFKSASLAQPACS
ncbi:MAG TPA: hypothetical protein IGS17_15825 [Oscillatoriales cyanobacterium M59_W2019_021]|nr:hypothetical protein [Oscillatoriales cyanobacterium M59_W2019_021]